MLVAHKIKCPPNARDTRTLSAGLSKCKASEKPSENPGLKVVNVLKSKMNCLLLLPTSFAMHSKRGANWAKRPWMRAIFKMPNEMKSGSKLNPPRRMVDGVTNEY